VLGIKNTGNAVRRLDSSDWTSIRLADRTNGSPNRCIISESGLYGLILRSDKPEAFPFRYWVTHEVLPSIRKTSNGALQFQDR
jgi:anti-repressor protein